MSTRFTLDGSVELERHLAGVCDAVRDGVKALIPAAKLEGLALAGGYGRGEGGVLRTADGDAPYNDIEFFVFVSGSTFLNERRFKAALHALGERLTPSAGIEVEFKIISAAELRRAETSMFYYDLVMGHRWLIGDDRLLEGTAHHHAASLIPLREATRLLFNRCSGLLFARERLPRTVFTPEDADFVARNIAKAQLALGDALLAAEGRYHWSCRERHQRLQAEVSLRRHHAIGVEFKLHPRRSNQSREALLALHNEVSDLAREIFLTLEGRRLGRSFASVCEYAHNGDNKCPEQPLWKNVLQHLRTPHVPLGVPQPVERHPREALLHALCLMLWGDLPITRERMQAYTALWHRFN
jgi:hypothetical protein